MTLGQKLKKFRVEKGISQLNLELTINASTGSISRIENDKINPTKETLLRISNALNLSKIELSSLFNIEAMPVSQPKSYLNLENHLVRYLFNDFLEDTQLEFNYSYGKNNFIYKCTETLYKSFKEVKFIGNSKVFREYYPEDLDQKIYVTPRIKSNKMAKLLLSKDGTTSELSDTNRDFNQSLLRQSKVVQQLSCDFMVNINDLSVVFMGMNNGPAVLEINDKRFVDKANQYFENLWAKV